MDVERARATIAAEKPRRLRLAEMLRDLGARVEEQPPETADVSEDVVRRESINVGELVDRAAESGFGFLVGVLALIAIPFFGLSTPFGLAIALVGVQPAIGRARPWLPKRMRRRDLKMTMLDRVLGLLAKRLGWLARSTRRRWEPLIMPRLVGLAITGLGLGLALPLPIPGSNMIFIIPIIMYAVGLLERDGVWIVVAHACTLVDLALVIAFGATIVAVLSRVWHWL